jgi:hypothetical protein
MTAFSPPLSKTQALLLLEFAMVAAAIIPVFYLLATI